METYVSIYHNDQRYFASLKDDMFRDYALVVNDYHIYPIHTGFKNITNYDILNFMIHITIAMYIDTMKCNQIKFKFKDNKYYVSISQHTGISTENFQYVQN